MPQRDVFESRLGIGPHHARQTADLLARDRIPLVRHGRGALLARREVLRRLAHFGALQMADFERDFFEARRQRGQRGDEMRMAVALDHLRRHRRGRQTQPRADLLFDLGADMRERAHGARDLAHAQIFRRRFETLQIAPGFLVPDGELQPERDRLGMNAMRAADLHRVLEFEARGASALRAVSRCPSSRIARRLAKLQRLRGIHDVVRRHAVVEPARGFRRVRPRPSTRPPRS